MSEGSCIYVTLKIALISVIANPAKKIKQEAA